MKSAGADLHVQRLHDHATLLGPVVLQRLDQPLKSAANRSRVYRSYGITAQKPVIIANSFGSSFIFIFRRLLTIAAFCGVLLCGHSRYDVAHAKCHRAMAAQPQALPLDVPAAVQPGAPALQPLLHRMLTLLSLFSDRLPAGRAERSYASVCAQDPARARPAGGDGLRRPALEKQARRGFCKPTPRWSASTDHHRGLDSDLPHSAAKDRIRRRLLLITPTLAILIWNLAVLSLIFKRAFEISTHLSAMISFNYFVVYQFIVIWLY